MVFVYTYQRNKLSALEPPLQIRINLALLRPLKRILEVPIDHQRRIRRRQPIHRIQQIHRPLGRARLRIHIEHIIRKHVLRRRVARGLARQVLERRDTLDGAVRGAAPGRVLREEWVQKVVVLGVEGQSVLVDGLPDGVHVGEVGGHDAVFVAVAVVVGGGVGGEGGREEEGEGEGEEGGELHGWSGDGGAGVGQGGWMEQWQERESRRRRTMWKRACLPEGGNGLMYSIQASPDGRSSCEPLSPSRIHVAIFHLVGKLCGDTGCNQVRRKDGLPPSLADTGRGR